MSAAEAFLVRTARQLRVLNSPARLSVVEAMMGRGPSGVADVARLTGMAPESVRYHLSKLSSIGLVRDAGTRGTGARPERLFDLVSDRIELTRERRGPAFRRELARGARLMLRLAEREFERAVQRPSGTDPVLSRSVGWLTPEDLSRVRELVQELEDVLRASGAQRRGGRRPVSLTLLAAPLDSES